MAGRYCEGKIKMASEKVSRKMVLEIKYVNANNAVIHTENSKLLLDLNCKLVTGILAKISLGTGIWAKFRLGTGIWYPPSRPSSKLRRIFTMDCSRCTNLVHAERSVLVFEFHVVVSFIQKKYI